MWGFSFILWCWWLWGEAAVDRGKRYQGKKKMRLAPIPVTRERDRRERTGADGGGDDDDG